MDLSGWGPPGGAACGPVSVHTYTHFLSSGCLPSWLLFDEWAPVYHHHSQRLLSDGAVDVIFIYSCCLKFFLFGWEGIGWSQPPLLSVHDDQIQPPQVVIWVRGQWWKAASWPGLNHDQGHGKLGCHWPIAGLISARVTEGDTSEGDSCGN